MLFRDHKTPEYRLKSRKKYVAKRKDDPAWVERQREYSRQYRLRMSEERKALNTEYRKQRYQARKEYEAAYAKEFGDRARLVRKGLSPDLLSIVRSVEECEICGGPPGGRWDTFHVDHCHATGGFRGMLCAECNSGLARFKDDPETLRAAALYLERYTETLELTLFELLLKRMVK